MSKARIIWTCIGVGVMACMLIAAAVWGYKMRPTDAPCVSLEFVIEDKAERMYVTEAELDGVLRAEGIHPVGNRTDRLSLHKIEQTIQRHPMVRTAECYSTPRHEVRVRLTQRVPLLRVQMPGDTYFIDTDRRVMQARAAVKDRVPVATGAIGVHAAAGVLADFAQWLQDNAYWNARVHHIHVQSPQMVYLFLKGEDMPRVVLGPMYGYERKLAKLRTFIENSGEATQDKHYTELDVRFRGQVIGRK